MQSGAVLFYAGELADGGYVVQEGSFCSSPDACRRQEMIVGPGTLIGELALLTDMVCQATAIAKEPTIVIRISRSLFRKMLEGYPDAAEKMRDIMIERLQSWSSASSRGENVRSRRREQDLNQVQKFRARSSPSPVRGRTAAR